MRNPKDIPGGLPGVARWAFGGLIRLPIRTLITLRDRLVRWSEPRRAARAARRAESRWKREIRRRARGRFKLELLRGMVSVADVPVIVCLWNRPARIDAVLAMLDAQSTEHGIRLMLWNNNPADDRHYRDRIDSFEFRGALRSVEYHSSRQNLGGFARFFLARRARVEGTESPFFIMLDDDQDVSPSFVDDLLNHASRRSYGGVWAWHYIDSHWNRSAAEAGDEVDYVGTGGSVCDLSIVDHDELFAELPYRFAFLEDQWLSSFAKTRGWSLIKIDTPVRFVLHETNQFPALAGLKDEFRRFLIERGRQNQQTAR